MRDSKDVSALIQSWSAVWISVCIFQSQMECGGKKNRDDREREQRCVDLGCTERKTLFRELRSSREEAHSEYKHCRARQYWPRVARNGVAILTQIAQNGAHNCERQKVSKNRYSQNAAIVQPSVVRDSSQDAAPL